MKHSEILQLALDKHLDQPGAVVKDKIAYICLALNRAIYRHPYQAFKNKEEIVDYVMECLHPATTVTGWLMHNNYIKNPPNKFEQDQVQLYRKRWMLHLIEEYKKQGK